MITAGCSKKDISDAEKNALVAAAEPIADSVLEGYNSGDYAAYSKDFDEQMKNALPEKVFAQTREQIQSKIGAYESRAVSKTYGRTSARSSNTPGNSRTRRRSRSSLCCRNTAKATRYPGSGSTRRS